MDDSRTSKSDFASDSTEIRSGSGNGRAEATDSTGATMTLAPLKSIQPYRTQDEFLVAMKEDLAEWLTSVYDIDMDENSLFTHLATGVLLCRHANSFNAAATLTQGSGTVGSRRNSGINFSTSGVNPSSSSPSSCNSGACPSISGAINSSSVTPFSTVSYRENAQPGTFQSRDNIANFLRWCRYTLGLRDTLLFETEDLVQGRNERNVVLCLLEVARRGARIGMPAPSLVRLEAEIDAEIARDEAASLLLINEEDSKSGGPHGNCDTSRQKHDDVHGNSTCTHPHGDAAAASDGKTKDAQIQTTDEDLLEAASPPPNCRPPPFLLLRSSFDSISSSDSSSVRGGYPHHSPAQPRVAAAAAAAAAVGRQRRPVIEVDMMSLDEMVRNILNKCTCEFQYPMVRVSEGKYKIGDSLTLIFVRILRNHVMVRIGGGWDTLENYLNRHDPCRMETRVTKSSSSHLRSGAHTCGAAAAGVGAGGVGRTGVAAKDGTVSCDTVSEARNERSFEENPAPESSEEYTKHKVPSRPVDPVIHEAANLINEPDDLTSDVISSQQSLQTETQDSAGDGADRSTGPTFSDKRTADVACQTDDPTRRYSSSSGASSWESTRGDDKCSRVEVTGCNDVTLDAAAPPDFDNCYPSRIEFSEGSVTDPLSNRPDCTPERESGRSGGRSNIGQPTPSRLGCPQCGQSVAAGKQTVGLCRLCRQRRGQLRPASAKDARHLPQCPSPAQAPAPTTSYSGATQERRIRALRPASAQNNQERLLCLDSDLHPGIPHAVLAAQRPTSAQSQRQRTTGSAPAQKQRRRTLGPASIIQDNLNRTLGHTSTPGQLNRTVGYAPGQERLVTEQRRNSLGPVSTLGQLHRTSGPALAQDLLDQDQEQQRPRQRTQRPASAQEHRRFAKRSRADAELKPESILESARRGENTPLRYSPAEFSRKPLPLTSTLKAAPEKSKSQDDLLTKEGAATNRKSPGETQISRKISSRSQADRQHIRELFKIKNLDTGCSYDIPELVEQSSEDLPPTPAQASMETQIRPRKDVGRNRSFSKIPKPVAMN